MITIVCDSCKKAIPGPEKQTGVVYILDKALCRKCEKDLQESVSEEMDKQKKFRYRDYQDLYLKTMYKMCK